jgi:hypothetical protein
MHQHWLKTVLWFGVIAATAACGGQFLASAQQSPAAVVPARVVMTSQQDRQRVMDQLKITLFPLVRGPTWRPRTMRTPQTGIRIYQIR